MTCSLCDRPAKARGWCKTHWMRWKRHGDPTIALRTYGPFWSKVRQDGDCLIWTAALSDTGYGVYRHNDVLVLAHRHAYEDSAGVGRA